ncbi:peptidyl-prolyl cis-trans isomerase [Tumebacillus sp. ITR2]|uniref:peptidylprolyl isomerase n=1 Tax=Tumebacillus amylolyticus TaxID=2801339 RepID=A0ABS1J9P7_9BACL|nr:peptidylprolyl isomerase [Tumebacillus amylolyticus]MBL0387003.1 peptidyl-prolyl cis-trans isomerase [Tumebacillus amylolyticus]
MKKRQRWLLSGALLLVVLGGSAYGIHAKYQPLLFVVGDSVMRQDQWNTLKPELFAGVPYTRSDDVQFLERRAMEELVLAKAKSMGVTYDESVLTQQLSQFGATPEERAKKLTEMNTTEEKVRTNYERALTAFALKSKMTQDVSVSEQEINDYYEQNKALFYAPEFRSVYFLRAKQTDSELYDAARAATPETFPDLIKKYTDETANRLGAWHELDSSDHLASHTSQHVAELAFQAPVNKIMGPVQENGWNYFYMISEIKAPHQFSLLEEKNKIQSTILQDKQLAEYRTWLNDQKDDVGYSAFPENLDREPLAAFWHDLTQNFKLWF